MVIFTTIQVQDYPDIEGDAESGRVTFPIYAPEFSRLFTLSAIIIWSFVLSWFWDIGILGQCFLAGLGAYVGARYYLHRTPIADKKSYKLFNVIISRPSTFYQTLKCLQFGVMSGLAGADTSSSTPCPHPRVSLLDQ